mgnify:CR=1 FL=1
MKKFYLLLAAALTFGAAVADEFYSDSYVYATCIPEKTSLTAGETMTAVWTITENNDEKDIIAGKFEMQLPAGLTVLDCYEDADGEPCNYEWVPGAVYSSEICATAYNNDTYKWAWYNPTNRQIRIMTGGLFTITIQADENFVGGNMVITSIDLVEYTNKTFLGLLKEEESIFPLTNPSTAIEDVNANKTVAGKRYFNIAGVETSEATQGVNIVVTTYTDGTTSTAKVLK